MLIHKSLARSGENYSQFEPVFEYLGTRCMLRGRPKKIRPKSSMSGTEAVSDFFEGEFFWMGTNSMIVPVTGEAAVKA